MVDDELDGINRIKQDKKQAATTPIRKSATNLVPPLVLSVPQWPNPQNPLVLS